MDRRPQAAPEARLAPAARTIGGHRVVFVLLAIFAVAVLLACGLAFVNRPIPEQGLRPALNTAAAMDGGLGRWAGRAFIGRVGVSGPPS